MRKWAGWFECYVQEVNAQLANKVGAHIYVAQGMVSCN